MSRNTPLAGISTARTPQTQPIPGRTGMVRNNAGGYTFAKDIWTGLEDFLILGTTGGTYYVSEQKLTADNATVVFEAINADGPRSVALAVDVSTSRPPRAPKNFPALFVLAAALARGDLDTRRAARAALPQVARTTDHLAAFFGFWKNLAGKAHGNGTAPVTGRLVRGAFADWLNRGTPDDVAFAACKAMQRATQSGEPFHLRDVLRVSHAAPDSDARRALFGWIAGNVTDTQAREALPAVDRFLTAKAVTSPAEAVRVVTEQRVPWEFLPDAVLRSAEVWEALVDTVGMTALIRNLARMTSNGALTPLGDATRRAVARLTDTDTIRKARIHPMDAYLALRVYASGRAQPNPKAPARTWTPVPAILDALEETYELSFGSVQPSGKRLLVAVDSSGSMGWAQVLTGGSPLGTAYQVANAMAVILARIERGNVHVIDVDTAVHSSRITARTNLREIDGWRPSGGGTDLSLPFAHAQRERMAVDGVVVFTDNETWAGRSHPAQALDAYRASVAPRARAVVASMTAAGHTIADPQQEGVLNIAGMDASLPTVVSGFVRG